VSLVARIRESRFLRFAFVGGTGFFVNEAVLFVIIKALHVNAYVAGVLAFIFTVTYTWMGNRLLTFRSHAAKGAFPMAAEWVKFVGANLIGFAVNYAVYSGLVAFARAPLNSPFIALACGTAAGLIFNFALSKRLVFRAVPPPA
jgi:putative flippase GtrA